jgi:hypothetical protein
VLDRLRLAGLEGGARRRPALGVDGVDPHVRPQLLDRAGDPDREAAAAVGHEHRLQVGEVLDELEPDRPVPGHHALVLDGVDEEPIDAVEARVDDRLPPALPRHLDHPAAEALDPLELRLRGAVGADDRRRDARLACGPRDALRHVPGARRDHAALQLVP